MQLFIRLLDLAVVVLVCLGFWLVAVLTCRRFDHTPKNRLRASQGKGIQPPGETTDQDPEWMDPLIQLCRVAAADNIEHKT